LAGSQWFGRVANQFYISPVEELQTAIFVSIMLRANSQNPIAANCVLDQLG
jgi:hypothetical protein